MSKLKELIGTLCPDGVGYKKLGDLCSVKGRIGWQRLKKSEYLTEGDYYLITGVDIRSDNRVDFQSCYYVSKERYDLDKNIQLQNDDIILTKDGTIGKVALIEGMDKPAVLNSHLFVIRDCSGELIPKFLMYVLLSNSFKDFIKKNQTKGTIPGLTQATIINFVVPVPPLEVQREIVRILDNFTELTSELTSELTARKQQYEYYRDALLPYEDLDIEFKPIRDCVLPISNIKWKGHSEETYKYIDLSSVDRDNHAISNITEITMDNAPSRAQQLVKTGDILFGTTRPLLRRYCMISSIYNGEICSTGFCVLRPNKKIILNKWLYYVISSTRFFSYVENNQQGASYPAITDKKVKEFLMPVPPIEVQQKIIQILDSFDKLCSDLFTGLPAEIEARQKQYEYYRDKLLTFKKKAV